MVFAGTGGHWLLYVHQQGRISGSVLYAVYRHDHLSCDLCGRSQRHSSAGDDHRHDICSQLVIMLRQVDTATNVCPSIHVFATLGVLLSVMRSPRFTGKRLLKGFLIILSVLICLATVFLKQHSVIDLFCGTALAVIMYHWTYHCNWRRGAVKTPIRALL